MSVKITIAIPSYNNEATIRESIESAFNQSYPNKEILVVDDKSTDNTVSIVKEYPQARLYVNEENLGIGRNLKKLMQLARGEYILYLCADDLFTTHLVATDVVQIFNKNQDIGVIGRFFYFFMDKHPGAIGVCRDRNILTNSCCPSGMAFRRNPDIEATNKIFIEMPYIVSQYLKDYRWTMIEYDTIAARFHPGGNTGTKKSYYKESPLQNWIDLTGDKLFQFHEGFIQLKNRAPHLLIPEIKLAIKMNPKVLTELRFWMFGLFALLVPGFISRPFTNFYRHRITRRHVKVIQRGEEDTSGAYRKKGIF